MEVNNTSTSESNSAPVVNESDITVTESGTERPAEEVRSSSSNAQVAQTPARATSETDRPNEEVPSSRSGSQVTQVPAVGRRFNATRPMPSSIIDVNNREGVPLPPIPRNIVPLEGNNRSNIDSNGVRHELFSPTEFFEFIMNEVYNIIGHADNSIGLSAERIERFHHFDAGADLAGKRCQICMDDLTIGSRMVRLDCHEGHVMCETCVDNWFGNHNTCPMCRKVFQ